MVLSCPILMLSTLLSWTFVFSNFVVRATPCVLSGSTQERSVRTYDVSDLCASAAPRIEVEVGAASGDSDHEVPIVAPFYGADPSEASADAPLRFLREVLAEVLGDEDSQAEVKRIERTTVLQVTASTAAQDRVSRALSAMRRGVSNHELEVECRVIRLAGADRELAGTWLESSSQGWASREMTAEELNPLLQRENAALDSRSRWNHLPRTRVSPLQDWRISAEDEIRFVQDYERIQVVGGREVVVPIIGACMEGVQVRGRVAAITSAEGELEVAVGFFGRQGHVEQPVESFPTELGEVQLPRVKIQSIRCTIVTREGVPVAAISSIDEFIDLAIVSVRSLVLSPSGDERAPNPRLDGRVSALAGERCVLSLGSKDRVTVGLAFEVYRGGMYKGRVVVVELFADRAVARTERLAEGEVIEVGDSVTTRL